MSRAILRRMVGRRAAIVVILLIAACDGPAALPDAPPRVDALTPDAEVWPDARPQPSFAVQYADPDHGPFHGGTRATIRGVGFGDDVEVWVGGRRVLEQRVVDARRIEIQTPPGEPGAALIEVRRGGSTASLDAGYRYEAIAVEPPTGAVAGGTYVVITGLGTAFDATTQVTFDGLPLSGLEVHGAERLTGLTPPGTAGDADVVVRTGAEALEARRGYSYQATGDPFAGGFSGGPIRGAVNVVVIDAWTDDGVPGAFVALGDPATTRFRGTTDRLGQITFSAPDLVGPVTVTATAPGFEVASFHCFDAANVTISLRSPLPPPPPEPPPTGSVPFRPGSIAGAVLFGATTSLGSPYWNLVPEPRTATERKRLYVTTTSASMYSTPGVPLTFIDYEYAPGRLSWPFRIEAWPGAYAVVAVAGLYDPARDPRGGGLDGFEPFAIGAARGVLVGPAEDRTGVDIVVDAPLDGALRVGLDRPPLLDVPGWSGPTEYLLRGFVDLGGEGAISFGAHGLPWIGDLAPGQRRLPIDAPSALVTGVPALVGSLGDGAYSFLAGAYTRGGAPMSVRVVRGVHRGPVSIGGFLGMPRAVDPLPDQTATRRRVAIAPEPPPDAPATFLLHTLTADNGDPVWRGIACPGSDTIDLPDLSAIRAWPPPGDRLRWTVWRIQVPGADYDQYTYRWNGTLFWSAYATDSWWVRFPP